MAPRRARPALEVVDFITIQTGDDLIVSFALQDEGPWNIVSLTLLRTPQYEFIQPLDERGVSVSHESFPELAGKDRLQRISIAPPVVTIETRRARYQLDVSNVDGRQLQHAQQVLERMNFDGCFVLALT